MDKPPNSVTPQSKVGDNDRISYDWEKEGGWTKGCLQEYFGL